MAKLIDIPSLRVVSAAVDVTPRDNTLKATQPVGDRLLAALGAVGIGRDRNPEIKGLALIHADWKQYFADKLARPEDEEKHIPLRFEQCLPLGQEIEELSTIKSLLGPEFQSESGNEVVVKHTPGGSYLSTLHRGALTSIRAAYAALASDLSSAAEIEYTGGPVMELYLDKPESTPENEMRTQVCVPVRVRDAAEPENIPVGFI